jgi:hypothetical protein
MLVTYNPDESAKLFRIIKIVKKMKIALKICSKRNHNCCYRPDKIRMLTRHQYPIILYYSKKNYATNLQFHIICNYSQPHGPIALKICNQIENKNLSIKNVQFFLNVKID